MLHGKHEARRPLDFPIVTALLALLRTMVSTFIKSLRALFVLLGCVFERKDALCGVDLCIVFPLIPNIYINWHCQDCTAEVLILLAPAICSSSTVTTKSAYLVSARV